MDNHAVTGTSSHLKVTHSVTGKRKKNAIATTFIMMKMNLLILIKNY